jgi:hypothetical protein
MSRADACSPLQPTAAASTLETYQRCMVTFVAALLSQHLHASAEKCLLCVSLINGKPVLTWTANLGRIAMK